jgi:hypothetical protein
VAAERVEIDRVRIQLLAIWIGHREFYFSSTRGSEALNQLVDLPPAARARTFYLAAHCALTSVHLLGLDNSRHRVRYRGHNRLKIAAAFGRQRRIIRFHVHENRASATTVWTVGHPWKYAELTLW